MLQAHQKIYTETKRRVQNFAPAFFIFMWPCIKVCINRLTHGVDHFFWNICVCMHPLHIIIVIKGIHEF